MTMTRRRRKSQEPEALPHVGEPVRLRWEGSWRDAEIVGWQRNAIAGLVAVLDVPSLDKRLRVTRDRVKWEGWDA